MRQWLLLPLAGMLAGCGSITLPAAVQLADGTPLIGTTTAAVSGGHFSVASPDKKVTCSGTYDALDQSPTISVPFTCNNGLYGNAIVTRSPDGMRGAGTATISDGTAARLAFGNGAGGILTSNASTAPGGSAFPPAPTIGAPSPLYASTGTSLGSGRTYTGNCPTPDSVDAAGRRCGARSAASRPGGYDGYGSWSSSSYRPSYGGRTYVRGHYRNGSWVRGHYRRR